MLTHAFHHSPATTPAVYLTTQMRQAAKLTQASGCQRQTKGPQHKAGTHLVIVGSVPLVLNDDGALHVLVQGLLGEGVHLLASLQGLLPQSHLTLLGCLGILLGICNNTGCKEQQTKYDTNEGRATATLCTIQVTSVRKKTKEQQTKYNMDEAEQQQPCVVFK